ncbi:hypothetical protein J8273_0287 [Carpediemonas membranifera]|uniref:Uncharacterized protein n=1 Tax=Carpediemonas membranifera TaxID=201153 RepID=A0A8J6AUI2_9EUKA|nr:hypothetical protein J8273_0287 [Carpediemonas membranifera]|eukprot:KAG9395071.1 hypothetical protein J8273_0287 [Carpediemonas membranifera]
MFAEIIAIGRPVMSLDVPIPLSLPLLCGKAAYFLEMFPLAEGFYTRVLMMEPSNVHAYLGLFEVHTNRKVITEERCRRYLADMDQLERHMPPDDHRLANCQRIFLRSQLIDPQTDTSTIVEAADAACTIPRIIGAIEDLEAALAHAIPRNSPHRDFEISCWNQVYTRLLSETERWLAVEVDSLANQKALRTRRPTLADIPTEVRARVSLRRLTFEFQCKAQPYIEPQGSYMTTNPPHAGLFDVLVHLKRFGHADDLWDDAMVRVARLVLGTGHPAAFALLRTMVGAHQSEQADLLRYAFPALQTTDGRGAMVVVPPVSIHELDFAIPIGHQAILAGDRTRLKPLYYADDVTAVDLLRGGTSQQLASMLLLTPFAALGIAQAAITDGVMSTSYEAMNGPIVAAEYVIANAALFGRSAALLNPLAPLSTQLDTVQSTMPPDIMAKYIRAKALTKVSQKSAAMALLDTLPDLPVIVLQRVLIAMQDDSCPESRRRAALEKALEIVPANPTVANGIARIMNRALATQLADPAAAPPVVSVFEPRGVVGENTALAAIAHARVGGDRHTTQHALLMAGRCSVDAVVRRRYFLEAANSRLSPLVLAHAAVYDGTPRAHGRLLFRYFMSVIENQGGGTPVMAQLAFLRAAQLAGLVDSAARVMLTRLPRSPMTNLLQAMSRRGDALYAMDDPLIRIHPLASLLAAEHFLAGDQPARAAEYAKQALRAIQNIGIVPHIGRDWRWTMRRPAAPPFPSYWRRRTVPSSAVPSAAASLPAAGRP